MSALRREARLKIANNSLLAEQLDYLLAQRGPTQTELEKNTGIKQDKFSKLRNGKRKCVTASTYNTLRRLLPADRQKRLALAFERSGSGAMKERYGRWLVRSTKRILVGTGLPWQWNAGSVRQLPEEGWRGRAGTREGELKAAWAILDEWTGGQIRRFRVEHLKRGHSEARVTLAVYRTIAPLIEASDAAFVERHLHEMSVSELTTFVKCGLQREKLLLKRPPDIVRLQEVARLDREEFKKSFGRENLSWLQPPKN